MRTESRISLAEGTVAASKGTAAKTKTTVTIGIGLDLFNVSTNHLFLDLPNGSAAISSYQRAMDEPGPGFVHGRGQRRRCLEAAAHHRHFCRAHFWRIQGACLHFLFVVL